MRFGLFVFATALSLWRLSSIAGEPPYPPSSLIKEIIWHWDTLQTAAPGSDLWPITWAADDNLYTAWGDGGGFDGTDQLGRVSAGFARIEGGPEHFKGININGGQNCLHPASFPTKGKVGGMLVVSNTLYARVNLQNGTWPDVDQALFWSNDKAATWQHADWVFPKGAGNLKPITFLNFGKGYTGVPDALKGYACFYGPKQGEQKHTYLARASLSRMRDRSSYEFISAIQGNQPKWSADATRATPVFSDPNTMGDLASVIYVPGLKRFLLTAFHTGPSQLGVFDAPTPWGPWTTIAYYEAWGRMGSEGEGLTCSFPAKWMSSDGLTLWAVFAVYGPGAKQGINAHDRFNLVKASLTLK